MLALIDGMFLARVFLFSFHRYDPLFSLRRADTAPETDVLALRRVLYDCFPLLVVPFLFFHISFSILSSQVTPFSSFLPLLEPPGACV